MRSYAQLANRLMFDDLVFKRKAEVLYLHGLSVGMIQSCDLFTAVAYRYRFYGEIPIAVSGSDGRGAGDSKPGAAWPGVHWYLEELTERGVPGRNIIPTGPMGIHTRGECDEFVALAKERAWTRVFDFTVPYHWPSVMACMVGSMTKHDYWLEVFCARPATAPNWFQPMVGSQGTDQNSTYLEQAGIYAEKFCEYQEKGRRNNGAMWREAYGAPIGEIMKYLDWRDART